MAAMTAAPLFRDGKRIARAAALAAVLGAIALVLSGLADPRRAAASYLVAFAYVVSLQLGALLFLTIGYAARTVWTIPLRKLTESVASGLLVAPLLFVPIVALARRLYSWAGEHADHPRPLQFLPDKSAWLNVPAFATRSAVYFAVWIVVVVLLRRWSLGSDRDAAHARDPGQPTRVSAAALPVLGITLSFAAFDWLMSLEPEWFSAAYGVYYFAGSFVAAIALLTVLAFASERAGFLRGFFAASHYHALGRMLLAFTIFWTYIAYFQLFLIYIANRPEEVTFYVRRIRGAWQGYDYVLLFGHFVLPFLLLLLRGLKFRPRLLTAVAALIVLVHYLDVYWLVMPVFDASFSPHAADLGALLFVGGVATLVSVRLLYGQPVVPVNDPRLTEGVAYRSA